jgi:hypothetical protein
MADQAQGATTQVAQTAASGEQQGTQQTQANTQATQQASTQQASQTTGQQTTQQSQQPSIEELQKQIQERDEKLRVTSESARHWQSQADRFKQVALGSQPQVDPLAEDIKFFTAQGYDEKDARSLVEFTNRKVSGLQQQNQNLQNSLQASSMIGQILQSAAQDKDYIPLFNDPDIAFSVNQELQRVALLPGQKDANQLVEYAKAYAETVYTTKHKPWLQPNQSAQQPQAPQQRPFLGFNGNLQPGYTPVAAQPKASDPTVDALALKMAQHMGHKL